MAPVPQAASPPWRDREGCNGPRCRSFVDWRQGLLRAPSLARTSCAAECIEPGRNSAIGCRMQQGSFDLCDSNAIVERALDMQLDLGCPVQGREHRKVH